jgi:hypothetical protein
MTFTTYRNGCCSPFIGDAGFHLFSAETATTEDSAILERAKPRERNRDAILPKRKMEEKEELMKERGCKENSASSKI